MPSLKLHALWAVLTIALGCSSAPPGQCEGPQDCDGQPCCWRLVNVTDRGTSCAGSPSACVPEMGVDTLTTRLCRTDADCTAGGIETTLVHCCQESTRPFRACLSSCP